MDCRRIAITNPSGIWRKDRLIGGVVKISSLPWDFFGIDSDTHYKIEDIKYAIDQTGRIKCAIHLEGVKRVFSWKDLELVSLGAILSSDPICGKFYCGEVPCGYGNEDSDGEIKDLDGPELD